jgi:ketosteroid isomerase-like protein
LYTIPFKERDTRGGRVSDLVFGVGERDYYVDMVERRYFGSVDAKDLDGVLECFTKDATFTIQSEPRTHEGRDVGIKQMFENLFETFETKIVHRDFEHVVDERNNRCSARFEVELVDGEGNELRFSNCNFFFLDEEGKFERVLVWFSDENVLV